MSFSTASAILRGNWLIEKQWADAHMPIVLKMIKGQSFDWTSSFKIRDEQIEKLRLPVKKSIAKATTDVWSVTPYTSMDRLPYNSVVMVNVLGPVLKYGDYCSYGMVEYTDLMNRLAKSDRVKGILINIDSPGGQAYGTAMFAQAIRMASKEKPVLGIVQNGMAASAGMWIASAVQELYATMESDLFGSIGAYITLYDYTAYLEKEGVKIYEIYAPQSGDKNADYRQVMESKGENTTLISDELKFLVEEFKGAVAAYRGARLRLDKGDPFTGKMYRTKEAIKIGLIDGMKSMDAVVSRIEQLIALRA